MDSNHVNRRQILRGGGIMLAGAIIAGCGGRRTQEQPAAQNERPPLPEVPTVVLTDALIYMRGIGASVSAEPVESWFSTRLGPAEQATIHMLNTKIAAEGLRDFSEAKAFTLPGQYAYDVRHINKVDGCLMIFKGAERLAAYEGPALAGLARAIADWRSPHGITARQAFLPQAGIQDGPSAFGQAMQQPAIAKTAVGTLEIDYQTTPAKPLGMTLVTIRHDDGPILFKGSYDLGTLTPLKD